MIGSADGEAKKGGWRGGQTSADGALANADIVELTSAGVGAAAIVAKIKSSPTAFDVGVEKLIELGKAGVAEVVSQFDF